MNELTQIKCLTEEQARVYQSPGGAAIKLVVWPGNDEGKIAVHRVSVPPGKTLPMHSHAYSDDIITPIQGSGYLLTENDVRVPIQPGTSAVVPPGVIHEVVNDSQEETLEILGVLTPPDLDFYKKAGLLE